MKKRMNTKKLVYIGLLAAVATALMYLELPLTFLFMPPFLKLDISGVPTLIGTFMFGPAAGIFISLVKDLIHLLSSQTGGVGELSDFLIYTAFSLSAGFLYRYHKSKKGALLACLSGTAAVTVVGALTNRFLIIPFYSKLMPIDAIVSACNAVNPMIDSIDGYILFLSLIHIFTRQMNFFSRQRCRYRMMRIMVNTTSWKMAWGFYPC